MDGHKEFIPVTLDNGVTVNVEATMLGGAEDVAFDFLSFEDVTGAIEGIANTVTAAFEKVKPYRASVEFGLQITLGSGKLTTALIQGSGTSNLKVVLEWQEHGS